MSLTVWVLISRDLLRRQISRALKPLGPGKLILVFLRSKEQIERELHRLMMDPVSRFPDLLMAETGSLRDDGTQLLLRLRAYQSLDFLPLVERPSLETLLMVRSFGAFDILSQPFPDQRLRESVQRWIRSRQFLSSRTSWTQRSIDTYLRFLSPEERSSGLSGSGDPSRLNRLRLLHRLVLDHPEGLSAGQIARMIGISTTTVRNDLKTLEELELVRRENPSHGKRGRPVHIYFPSERILP
ncbi:MAG: HTH domain-containing protein [Firmicutes bacterium]|nr:HTH domain-containing protein [Bacillota bacterium]